MLDKCKTNRRLFKTIPFFIAALALVVVGCTPAAPKGLEQTTFRLDWLPSGMHAPFYAALDKGYYTQNGIALAILEGQGAPVAAKSVGAGQDTFGLSDATTQVLMAHQGIPIKVIAAVVQKNPFGIVALKERNITKPKDMEGKAIAITPGSVGATLWPIFAKNAGVDVSKVNVVSVDAPSMDRIILDKKVDAVGQFIPTVLVRLGNQGLQLNAIAYADHGVTLLGSALMANTATLKDKPDLVRRFLKATMMGYDYSQKNALDAVSVIKKYVLKIDPDDVLVKMLSNTMEYSRTDKTKDKPIGWMAKEDWEATQDTLFNTGQIKEKKPLDSYYTNDFLPK